MWGMDDIIFNFKHLQLKFDYKVMPRVWQGIVLEPLQVIDAAQCRMERCTKDPAFVLHVTDTQPSVSNTEDIPPELQFILRQFPVVFDEPTYLPPPKSFDHHIPIVEGAQPVVIKSYKHAYHLKNEIEKTIYEMLGSGIIRYSPSPYASHIIIVKK